MSDVILYFSAYPTVRYAAVALLLISLSASLLGVTLVLKRYSMIGDGLSHVTFGAATVATVLGFTTPIYLSLPLTVLAAILLLSLRSSTRVSGDAAIAMVSAGSLAFGYLLLNLFPPSGFDASADACDNLFGKGIVGVDAADVTVCFILSVAVLGIFVFFYNRIFSVTFDSDFAGVNLRRARLYDLLIAVTTGVMIVVAMEMVGALLISALITFPALSAMRVFKTFKSVTVCSAVISVICAAVGLLLSLIFSTPTGSTVVIADLAVFCIFSLIGRVRGRVR